MVLSRRLCFCVSPSKVSKEHIFSEFELMFFQLNRHRPSSLDKFFVLKVKLLELSSEYSSPTSEHDSLAWQNVHFRSIKSLKSSNAICINKPGKSSGVVILNSQKYID